VPSSRTLDWTPNFDPQSVPYRLALLDCYRIGGHKRSIQRTKKVWLDQGVEGACTGFGAAHVEALSPRSRLDIDNSHARKVYLEARRQDEWPGEDYDGSSVNGAMKALRLFGRIKSYRWAFSMDEVRHGLSYHGAAEIGVWWMTGMFHPDMNGFIHPTGVKEGGHALALSGYRLFSGHRAYRLDNSWGEDWGQKGGAWIWEDDLEMLRTDDGEIAFPVKAGV